MKNILVSDIMTKDPVTLSPNTSLLDCAKKMVRKRVGSIPLVEKKRLVGFLTTSDILWALIKKSKKDLSSIQAKDISPKKIATIKPSLTLGEAIKRIKKMKYRKLPVVFEGKLIGILTIKDILNFHPELYPELEEFSKIREESAKLKRMKKAREQNPIDGICEECGNREILMRVNGGLICESCKNSI